MSDLRKHLATLTRLAILGAALLFTLPAHAAPIRYQLTIQRAFINLGPMPYSNVSLTFTFTGDDSDVISGTVPSGVAGVPDISYSVIYKGVASVTIGAPTPITATFAPNQIVISIDHSNEGIGFGSVPGGVGSSGFDVTQLQPLYPAAISNYAQFSGVTQTPPGWMNYDLTLAYAKNHTNIFGGEFHADGSVDISAAVYSCNQFGGSIYNYVCSGPAAIPTDKGPFTMGQIAEPTFTGMGSVTIGEFTASAPPPTPLPPSSLSGTVQ